MSKIVSGELEIPCPYCTDGFATAGDRHARTRQDVCTNCGGSGRAPAGTGKTAATSAPPMPEPANTYGRAELPKPLTIEILMQLAYDSGHMAGTIKYLFGTGSYFDRRNEAVTELITDVEKAGHMPQVYFEAPIPSVLPGARFNPTDKVTKNRGDYWWSGVVVAAFYLPGTELVRYVVAHKVDVGHVLHIYSDAQLELVVDDE